MMRLWQILLQCSAEEANDRFEYGGQQGSKAATSFGVSVISQYSPAKWPVGLAPAGGMHLGDLCDISMP